jgi:hypothetical protein
MYNNTIDRFHLFPPSPWPLFEDNHDIIWKKERDPAEADGVIDN